MCCAVCAVHSADPQACREKAENTVRGWVLIAQLTAAAAVGLQAAMARTSNWGRSLQQQSSWLVQWQQAPCDAGLLLLRCGPRQLVLLLGEERLSECCGSHVCRFAWGCCCRLVGLPSLSCRVYTVGSPAEPQPPQQHTLPDQGMLLACPCVSCDVVTNTVGQGCGSAVVLFLLAFLMCLPSMC